MPCHHVKVPDGSGGFVGAIVCTSRPRRRTCSACGAPRSASRQCDWKTAKGPAGAEHAVTCDAWLCDRCTTQPAKDKDLCPEHARAYEAWKARRAAPAPTGTGGSCV